MNSFRTCRWTPYVSLLAAAAEARAVCCLAVRHLGYKSVGVGRYLGRSGASVDGTARTGRRAAPPATASRTRTAGLIGPMDNVEGTMPIWLAQAVCTCGIRLCPRQKRKSQCVAGHQTGSGSRERDRCKTVPVVRRPGWPLKRHSTNLCQPDRHAVFIWIQVACVAYECDPYFSLSIARVDPLPH